MRYGIVAIVQSWLRQKKGRKVEISVPVRGDKKKLVDMATENAGHALEQMKAAMRAKLGSTERALQELAEALGLPEPPKRIECFDISNTQGENQVASMVVCENGQMNKQEYRRFKIKREDEKPNDFASMKEVRVRRLLEAKADNPQASAACPTCSSWMAGAGRSLPRWPRSRRQASQYRSPGLRSSSSICFCPTSRTRSSCRAPPRRSTWCSASATGAPLRQHLPGAGPRQEGHALGTGRHPRHRPAPPQGASALLRLRHQDARRHRRRTDCRPRHEPQARRNRLRLPPRGNLPLTPSSLEEGKHSSKPLCEGGVGH